MLREELLYEDALEVMEKSFRGETVNQTSLTIASLMLQPVFTRIYEERKRVEIAKEADAWQEDLNDKA